MTLTPAEADVNPPVIAVWSGNVDGRQFDVYYDVRPNWNAEWTYTVYELAASNYLYEQDERINATVSDRHPVTLDHAGFARIVRAALRVAAAAWR